MQKILSLGWSDFRNIFREQILYFMFIGAPVMQYAVLLWGVPWLIDWYPIMAEYKALMLIFFSTTGGVRDWLCDCLNHSG